MTALEKFLSSAGVREKPFEINFNGSTLSGLVRIHPAADYKELIELMDEEKLAEQFLNADIERTRMFDPGTIEKKIPDAVLKMLGLIFIEANTGKKKED